MTHRRRSGLLLLIMAVLGFALVSCQQSITTTPAPAGTGETASPLNSDTAPRGESPSLEESMTLAVATPQSSFVDSVRIARSFVAQAERLGAVVTHDQTTRQWRAIKGDRQLVVEEGSRFALVDGIRVFLDLPLAIERGRSFLSASDESLILQSVFGSIASAERSVRVIAIDPGHGGSESGTRNEALNLVEKEINLDVSRRLQAHLESRGYRTIMTRYDDRTVSLDERVRIASKARADLFVSIHFNSAENREAQGLETFMLTPAHQSSTSGEAATVGASAALGNRFDVQNFELALRVQKELVSRLQRIDRGVKKAHSQVLRDLACPGVLVEAGFLSHDDEALLVSTAAYRERLAQSLADALDAYARNLP